MGKNDKGEDNMNELTGRTITMAELAALPEGGILSRVVMKSAAGNVTLFALAAGEEISEHSAPFDALVVGLDGVMNITLAGQPHAVAAGQMLIMPANVPHALRAAQPSRFLLVMLKG